MSSKDIIDTVVLIRQGFSRAAKATLAPVLARICGTVMYLNHLELQQHLI